MECETGLDKQEVTDRQEKQEMNKRNRKWRCDKEKDKHVGVYDLP